MTEHAAEAHVALDQLEVGLADAGHRYPHEHFVRQPGWGLVWTPGPSNTSRQARLRASLEPYQNPL